VDSETWNAQRLSFGPAAALYDRVRPRYPLEALRWILDDAPRRVVDLGAGTGILTRELVDLGHDVTAVEPDAGMRAQHGSAVAGSAEEIPLPDGSVDAVLAGQAYHWFDREKAHPEIARVLRLGGVIAPLWNVRDESVPWVARLTDLMDGIGARQNGLDERYLGGDAFGPRFGPAERATFDFRLTYTVDRLVDLMKSRSYYISATPERQAEVERLLRELTAEHPDLAGRDEFDLPYVTYCYKAHKIN
jgi:SAM-dependent methyltransferase